MLESAERTQAGLDGRHISSQRHGRSRRSKRVGNVVLAFDEQLVGTHEIDLLIAERDAHHRPLRQKGGVGAAAHGPHVAVQTSTAAERKIGEPALLVGTHLELANFRANLLIARIEDGQGPRRLREVGEHLPLRGRVILMGPMPRKMIGRYVEHHGDFGREVPRRRELVGRDLRDEHICRVGRDGVDAGVPYVAHGASVHSRLVQQVRA